MSRWRKVKQGKADIREPGTGNRESEKEKPASDTDKRLCAPVVLRLKAFLTDTFMITMPILYLVIYAVMGSREGFHEHMGEGWLIILVLHFAATMAFWMLKGQTPGMKAYELLLIDSQSGARPGVVKLVLRYVMLQVAILSFFGMFLPFFLKSRDGLHDLVSGTCIVHHPE